jgi:hypothetical protein
LRKTTEILSVDCCFPGGCSSQASPANKSRMLPQHLSVASEGVTEIRRWNQV